MKLSDLAAALDYLRRRHNALPLRAIPMRDLGKSGPTVLRRKSTRDPVLAVLADFNLIAIRLREGARVVYLHPVVARPDWSAS